MPVQGVDPVAGFGEARVRRLSRAAPGGTPRRAEGGEGAGGLKDAREPGEGASGLKDAREPGEA